MFIRKGEVLDYWYCTNVYKSILQKHSGKNFIHFIEHNINMHLNCFVYSKLVNYVNVT